MTLAIEDDEPTNPIDVGGFGADGVVTKTYLMAYPVEQSRWCGGRRGL
jgi:hypothetical protein